MADDGYDVIAAEVMRRLAESDRMIRSYPSPGMRQRGRYPVISATGLILMKSAHGVPLGPRDTGGIELQGDAVICNHWDSPVTYGSDTKTADFRYANGIVFPGQHFWATVREGLYWAESGGTMTIKGDAAADFSGGVGDITVDQNGQTYDVEVLDTCDQIILAGSRVLAHLTFDDDAWQIYVSRSCCPPSEG